jgi:predicted small lipoprotein YifL
MKMNHAARTIAAACKAAAILVPALTFLVACGQKGPLYLPGHSKDTPWPVRPDGASANPSAAGNPSPAGDTGGGTAASGASDSGTANGSKSGDSTPAEAGGGSAGGSGNPADANSSKAGTGSQDKP